MSRAPRWCTPTMAKKEIKIQGAGEFALLRTRFHHRRKDGNFHAEGGDRGGLRFVGRVDDEGSGEVGVQFGDAEGCGLVAELGEHFVGGAFEGFSADDGTNGENFFLVCAQMVPDMRDGENRADADQRVAGADDDAVGSGDGFEDARCGPRGFDAGEADATDDGFCAALDEIFLKMQGALVRIDDGGNGIVGHREDAGFHSQRGANGFGGLRQ